MTKYYRNEYLFSEIYLEEITQEPESGASLASLNTLVDYRDYAERDSLTKWKHSFIHKVLYALGFNVTETDEHVTLLHPMGQTGYAIGLCYVLPPEEDLNNTAMGQNWAEKTIRAIQAENDDRSAFNWGLLTNGERWRIYHLNEPTPYKTYLEIDLGVILDDKARAAYQVFFKFMKVDNFKPNEDGECQLDVFKRESQDKIDYIEKELEKALKPVEEGGLGVLSNLCMGYVGALRAEGVQNLDDEDVRRTIYHGAMLYMFRLLFLLYANARDLLSEENQALLETLLIESMEMAPGKANQEDEFQIWKQLQTIFVDIDQTYNGGLFSPQESEFTAFIEDHRIANTYLGPAIYNLNTYEEKGGKVKRISYRDLDVRHLGTLYEGLLEHKLYIAEEDTEVRKSKGKLRFIPVSQGGKIKVGNHVPAGQVYFAGDKNERKSTGSYYTPEYIVDYIVQNTVGEKLKELRDAYMVEQQENYQAYQRALHEDEKHRIARLVEERTLEFVRKRVLKLSVLDPAMGSGHFLVNATNLIANFITELLNTLGIEGESGTNTATWRRWVVENCIYGVDINPLAVELAKLSLWILSMAKEQPLSFLNHHLKCGDSLVGARLNEIGFYPGNGSENGKENAKQLSMFEADEVFKDTVRQAIERYQLIESEETASLADVEAKMELLELIDEALEPYKHICDLHTSIYFGNEIDEWQYQEAVETKVIPIGVTLDSDQRYFHWALEFPLIFTNYQGFDCFIGNPPYVDVNSNLFIESNYFTSDGRNLYNYFVERGITHLNSSNSKLGMIIPVSIICASRMQSVRKLISNNRGHARFINVDSSANPGLFFKGLKLRLAITFLSLDNNENRMRIHSSDFTKFFNAEKRHILKKIETIEVPDDVIIDSIIPKIGNNIEISILKKMLKIKTNYYSILSKDKDGQSLFYKGTGYNYMLAFKEPPFFEVNGKQVKNTKTKELKLIDDISLESAILTFSTSLFYWFWTVYSNCFDFTNKDLKRFPIDLHSLSKYSAEYEVLYDRIRKDLDKNALLVSYNKASGITRYFQYKARHTKPLFDEVDDLLGEIYGFNQDEINFIKNYDLRFRTDKR